MEKKQPIYLFLFLLQAIIHCNNPVTAQLPSPENVVTRCKKGNFKSDAYNKNLDLALDSLSSNIGNPEYKGFKSSQSGNPNELVNAIVLCPPYINPEACSDCIKKSAQLLKRDCPKKKEAVVFTIVSDTSSCMVRYADYKIEGKYDDWAWVNFQSPESVADANGMNSSYKLLVKAYKKAGTYDYSGIRYSEGSAVYGDTGVIYFAVQCTPDISQKDCSKCLNTATSGLKSNGIDKGKRSARRMSTHCYARYSNDPFFE